MTQIDLFASGFIPPVVDAPASVAATVVLTDSHGYSLIDTGAIPAGATIVSVQFFAAQGSFLPGILVAGIQPKLIDGATTWAGGGAVPPTSGAPLGLNDYSADVPITPALTLNPVTHAGWTRAQLFADTFGWYAVWDNTLSSVVQSAQASGVAQFFVRVIWTIATQPAPSTSGIALAGVTLAPPLWTYRIDGSDFLDGCSVLLTLPNASIDQIEGDAILSVTPTAVEFVATYDQVGQAGLYGLKVLNPDGQLSGNLAFTLAGPGVIVAPATNYMHVYGYAFVRPPTPNTTNAPLGLAPGASVTVFKSGGMVLESLFGTATGTPIANPLTADTNGFYSCYVPPEAIDLQFSGGGIPVPYTIGDALPLDPRVPGLVVAVAVLGGDLTAAQAAIDAAIAAVEAVPIAFPLGGSLVEGLENGAQVDALNPVTIVLNGSLLVGYTATLRATLKTDDAGTSVIAVLRNLTDASDAGVTGAVTATVATETAVACTIAAGVKQYRLQLRPQNATNFVYGTAYLELSK